MTDKKHVNEKLVKLKEGDEKYVKLRDDDQSFVNFEGLAILGTIWCYFSFVLEIHSGISFLIGVFASIFFHALSLSDKTHKFATMLSMAFWGYGGWSLVMEIFDDMIWAGIITTIFAFIAFTSHASYKQYSDIVEQ